MVGRKSVAYPGPSFPPFAFFFFFASVTDPAPSFRACVYNCRFRVGADWLLFFRREGRSVGREEGVGFLRPPPLSWRAVDYGVELLCGSLRSFLSVRFFLSFVAVFVHVSSLSLFLVGVRFFSVSEAVFVADFGVVLAVVFVGVCSAARSRNIWQEGGRVEGRPQGCVRVIGSVHFRAFARQPSMRLTCWQVPRGRRGCNNVRSQ